jgi:hypothetical protein
MQEDKIEFILPFEGMSVGDSFFVPSLKPAELLYIIDTRAKIAGIRIKSFVMTKEGHLGVRTWRIR